MFAGHVQALFDRFKPYCRCSSYPHLHTHNESAGVLVFHDSWLWTLQLPPFAEAVSDRPGTTEPTAEDCIVLQWYQLTMGAKCLKYAEMVAITNTLQYMWRDVGSVWPTPDAKNSFRSWPRLRGPSLRIYMREHHTTIKCPCCHCTNCTNAKMKERMPSQSIWKRLLQINTCCWLAKTFTLTICYSSTTRPWWCPNAFG